MTTTTHPLTPAAFSLLWDLTSRLADRLTAPPEVLHAVAYLTAAADPDRADRLSPRAEEPAALVRQLATWALHRVDDDVILLAQCRLAEDSRVSSLQDA